ncbi:MAG TPA: hypothetical protein DCE55_29255 [Planctomycetaceae bacterium]|nr:hypothetical protein [Planctomycetaceae bacterium]|tara:strand:- start:17739 stop:18053 length:315 start_codon:yes stop_codon:yes gene_type:complete
MLLEHSYSCGRLKTDVGHGASAYLNGDEDEATTDVRLTFGGIDGIFLHIDASPEGMAQLAGMIHDMLQDHGFCEHGRDRDNYCGDCYLADPDNYDIPYAEQTDE